MASPSSSASSMLTSMMLAPASTCCRATSTASSNFSSRISRANRREPGHVVPLADHDEIGSGRNVNASWPLSRVSGSTRGERRGGAAPSTISASSSNVARRRATTAAHDVQPAVLDELAQRAPPCCCGVRSNPPNSLGSPALGWQLTYTGAIRDSSST